MSSGFAGKGRIFKRFWIMLVLDNFVTTNLEFNLCNRVPFNATMCYNLQKKRVALKQLSNSRFYGNDLYFLTLTS